MSEFETPAEYHVLMAQKAFQLIRRGDKNRDKNKREISQLREKLAAFAPADDDRSEMTELDKSLSEMKITFAEETQLNIATLQKAKEIREGNSTTANRVEQKARPLIGSLKVQTEAVRLLEKNARSEMVSIRGELRAFSNVINAIPDCKTYDENQSDLLAPLKAESALVRREKIKELQELKECDSHSERKIIELDIESAQLDLEYDDEDKAIAQIDRDLTLEDEIKAERELAKEEILKEINEREPIIEAVTVEADTIADEADDIDRECDELQAEMIDAEGSSSQTVEEEKENALMEELHSLENDHHALTCLKANIISENQQKLDDLQAERVTTLKALQDTIAQVKMQRNEAASDKEDIAEKWRLKRQIASEFINLQDQRRVLEANRIALEASINAQKAKLQARRRSKRKADQVQQAPEERKKSAQCIPADPLPKSAERHNAEPRTPSYSQQPIKKPSQTSKPPSSTQHSQRRIFFSKETKKTVRPSVHPTAGRTAAMDIFDIFAFDDDDDDD